MCMCGAPQCVASFMDSLPSFDPALVAVDRLPGALASIMGGTTQVGWW